MAFDIVKSAAQGQKKSPLLDTLDARGVATGLSDKNQVGHRARELGLLVLCQRRRQDAPGTGRKRQFFGEQALVRAG